MKIAILSAFHETNTFSPVLTDKKNFSTNAWLFGDEIVKTFKGTKTPIGGFIDAIEQNGHEVVALFAAHATPAGTVERVVFEEIRKNFIEELRKQPEIDAVALELHGAHVVEGTEDPEAILCADVRSLIKDKPLAVVTDFHANMTKERLASATVWAGYRTNPHIDTYEAAIRSLESLFYYLDNGILPKFSFIKVPVIFPPIGQSTNELPFKDILKKANELREKYQLTDLIVHGGYSFSDIPYAGLGFTALGNDANKAERESALLELADFSWNIKDEFTQQILDVADVIARVLEVVNNGGKVAIADIADNINGGSAGDSTHVIKELLNLTNVKSLATICDPKAVENLKSAELNSEMDLALGGWSDALAGKPIEAKVKLIWQGVGDYVHEGLMNHGAGYSIGDAALVRIGQTDVLIQSFAQQPNDLAQFKITNINPDDYQGILLKGAAALRANWQPRVDEFLNASSLGTTDCKLERLNYQRLNKSVYPLNKELSPIWRVEHIV